MLKLLLTAAVLLLSTPAMAYIGPGAGISVLGSLLGILATIVIAIAAIVMWPLRKVLKKRRQAAAGEAETAGAGDTAVKAEQSASGTTPGELD